LATSKSYIFFKISDPGLTFGRNINDIFIQTRPSYGTHTPQSDQMTSPYVASSTNQFVSSYQPRQQQQARM